MSTKKFKYLFLVVILSLAVATLVSKISKYYALEYYLEAPFKGSYLFVGIEGIKGLLGDYFWVKADDYYHGGASLIAEECRGLHLHTDVEQKIEDTKRQQVHLDFIQRINAAIIVDEHIHLTGQEAKEVLPWFRLATLLNPHNVDAYVDGAFWLARRFQKPKEAMSFLEEGLRNNPDDYRIYVEFAFLYYYQGDFERAIDFLNKSKSLWKENDPNDNERSALYDFLGYLYEKTGDYPKAVENYRKFLQIFPNEQKVIEKIERINRLFPAVNASR